MYDIDDLKAFLDEMLVLSRDDSLNDSEEKTVMLNRHMSQIKEMIAALPRDVPIDLRYSNIASSPAKTYLQDAWHSGNFDLVQFMLEEFPSNVDLGLNAGVKNKTDLMTLLNELLANMTDSIPTQDDEKIRTINELINHRLSIDNDQTPPKNLVLAGGGAKGLAYGPAFRQLQDADIMDNIETVIGSSVGGLCAGMLALGNNMEEVEAYLESGSEGLMDIFNTSPLFSSASIRSIQSLLSTGAAAKGTTLYHAAQAAVAKSIGRPDATFADLKKKQGEISASGGKYRNLELTVTVDDPRGSYQIVCSAESTPNMPIALAMRMTAGLPPVFPPVKILPSDMEIYTRGATEPLVKYNRAENFPPFNPQTFYQLDEEQRKEQIKIINEDIFIHAIHTTDRVSGAVRDEYLYCSDGGIVDNLPIYLGMHKSSDNAGTDKTIAFNFEEPWRQRRRMENQSLYRKGKEITQEDELYYRNVALNIPQNDRVYHLFQTHYRLSHLPPSYELALLQKDNLLCFETDDISAADFTLETETSIGGVVKSHEDKVSYLLHSGFDAGEEYLSSQNIETTKTFEEMYPDTIEPTPSLRSQIESSEQVLEHLQSLISDLLGHQGKKDPTISAELFSNYREMRKHLEKAITTLENRESTDLELARLIYTTEYFTQANIRQIIEAKINCDRLYAETAKELGFFDKLHFKNIQHSDKKMKALQSTNPELGKHFETLKNLKQSSKLFNQMLSLVREQDVDRQSTTMRAKRRSRAIISNYQHKKGAPQNRRQEAKPTPNEAPLTPTPPKGNKI